MLILYVIIRVSLQGKASVMNSFQLFGQTCNEYVKIRNNKKIGVGVVATMILLQKDDPTVRCIKYPLQFRCLTTIES